MDHHSPHSKHERPQGHSGAEKARINAGWQCPECFGVRIKTFQSDRYPGHFVSWQCEECGCQWSPPIALRKAGMEG